MPTTATAKLVPSLVRTLVPLLVGAIVAGLVSLGIDLSAEAEAGLGQFLSEALTLGFSLAYYAAARYLEERFPALSVLLGSSKTPDSYSNHGGGKHVAE